MKCVITGGAGFIGSELAHTLIEEGHEVTILDNLSTGSQYNIPEKANFIRVDIAQDIPYMYLKRIENYDVLFHLAAVTKVEESIHNPLETHNNNITGTLNVLNIVKGAKIKRFILSSSCSVYGQSKEFPTPETSQPKPLSPYALSKLVGEQYSALFAILYGIETVCLRYANVYGGKQPTEGAYCNVLGIFANQLQNDQVMTIVGDGKQTRDYIHVSDVVRANIQAATSNSVGKADIINIGSGIEYSVNSVASMFGGDTTNIAPRLEPKKALLNSKKASKLLGWKAEIKLKNWIKEYKEKLGLNAKKKRTRKKSEQSKSKV